MAKISVSVSKGKGSLRHNNRNFFCKNVDPKRTPNNVTYVKEDLLTAYEKCFGKAIAEYDAKQKRADRKIGGAEGYLEQIKASKNGELPFYEIICQCGNAMTCHVGSPNGETAKQILHEYMLDFQKRNPNLYVFNAVLHLDEATPHLHIDYIPLGHGYKNGLSVRNSLSKALEEQGIEGENSRLGNRTIHWENSEREELASYYEREGWQKEPDRGLKRKHLSVEEYKLAVDRAKAELETLPQDRIPTAPMMLNKRRVTVDKKDLEKLERKAQVSAIAEQSMKKADKMLSREVGRILLREEEVKVALEVLVEETAHERELSAQAEQKYNEQLDLNKRYDALYNAYEKRGETIRALQSENAHLRAERLDLEHSIDQRIKDAVAPFKAKIEALENRLRELGKNVTSIVKAINMFQSSNPFFKANLNREQTEMLEGIRLFAKKKIEEKLEGLEEVEQYKADIDDKMLVKGIQRFMPSMNEPYKAKKDPFKQNETERSSNEWER